MNEQVVIALGVPYRHAPAGVEFLIVKRVPDDGDFWQPITGGIEVGEAPRDTIIRELLEEAGIADPLHVSDELARTVWIDEGDQKEGIDILHAIEIHAEALVRLNPTEHEDHRWLPLDEAIAMLRYDNNKQALRLVHEYALCRTSLDA